ncbi:gamma-glutamylcyclotransferase [Pseudonocardia sp.]|uniref:gamma-glutamylcyclotransferase n=1 Tax=Pseudonocardia sp. TaxID=60912 RepID=UPI003D09EB00
MRDADFPADPYPGAVPPCSFVHEDGGTEATILRLRPDPSTLTGWSVAGNDLDDWLAARDAPPAAARVPVLAYGSNRCPSKITWLRRELGLPGPVIVLRARTEGVAAVWAHGLRARDGQRPAVLAAAPGAVETHAVWLATAEQIAVLDRCEGRDDRFRLARLRTGTVRTEDGGIVETPWCYVGHGTIRRPLLVDGRRVRCIEVAQVQAQALNGEPGDDDLDAPTVRGAPDPDDWPAALLTYGLLMPTQPSWSLVAPHASGPPRPLRVAGTLYDTGQGWPALVPGGRGEVPAALVPLRDPVRLLPLLDEYEGPDYRRVRRTLADGTACWVYAWVAPTAGFRELPAGWPP